MAEFSVNANRFDLSKNFKFRVKWDGRYVAGFATAGALKRTTEVAEHSEGGDPSTGRQSPGRSTYEAITLERGVTHDTEFEKWASEVWNFGAERGSEASLKDSQKDCLIDVLDEEGKKVLSYKVYRCWVSEFQALPDLDANSNTMAIETLKLENEGWERNVEVVEPKEPHAAHELGDSAQRLEPAADWDQLVLPDEAVVQLREIIAQVSDRSRVHSAWGWVHRSGQGISALFAGPPGTGKTMAAEILAAELNLPLYRIDLSKVVGKYVGETEKNLSRLFDAAERGGAILFFDEADALFGKRTEVKDSRDRCANIEINDLLQRLEDYRGLAILATNRKADIDDAFLRRSRFVVTFPFPGPASRLRI